MFFHIYFFSFR